MPDAAGLLPHLPADLEKGFRTDHYARIRPMLRVMAPLLAALFAACAVRDLADTGSPGLSVAQDGVPAGFFLLAFALTWLPAFGRFWQPVLAAGGVAACVVSFRAMTAFMAESAARHGAGRLLSHPGHGALSADALFLGQQVCLLMVCMAALRLRFRWALALQAGMFGAGVWAYLSGLGQGPDPVPALFSFLRPVAAIFAAVLLAALIGERLAAKAFVAEHLLAEERDDERRRREETEGQLRVLARAIGSIVHDQGNPLTAVQLGADLLLMRANSGDAEAIRRLTETVQDGAQMLAALRLSLIEQTRALEGKPIPVDLRAEALRPIVEAGARFQSGRLKGGRDIVLAGEDLDVGADRMKLVTVLMNLIGNALKYSDGTVRVVWQAEGESVLVGVLDQGTAGWGLSEAQAAQLFTPFGRLEAHADVEGTGLGLVSARRIVEAHGGEVFVEGHRDGTPGSAPFSTAPGRYPSLLAPGFLTAFVLACPKPHGADAGAVPSPSRTLTIAGTN